VKPDQYFPKIYLKELRLFWGHRQLQDNGPQWVLCGMTMSEIFDPQKRKMYEYLEDFFSTLYCLNLINQGIHCYYCADFLTWCDKSVPFPDCLCSSYHGGVSTPQSIIQFIGAPFGISGASPIVITNQC
jgi:hypothetical protein